MTIRTRFAPSPTGYLHIGGVRTALFNWLLTKRLGGQFVLRIDDTDSERNRPEALTPILEGFRWLGIQWDEGPEVGGPHTPYFQSGRLELYQKAAISLLEQGLAYPDYMTKEELDSDRKLADNQKRAYIHRGPLRDNSRKTTLFAIGRTRPLSAFAFRRTKPFWWRISFAVAANKIPILWEIP